MEKDTVAEMIDADERFESIMFNMENAIERYFLTLNGTTELLYYNMDNMKDALGLDGIQKIARDYHLHFSQLYRYWEDNFAPTLLEHEGIDMSEYSTLRKMAMLYDALNNMNLNDVFGSPFVNFCLYGVNTFFGITLHFGGFVWSQLPLDYTSLTFSQSSNSLCLKVLTNNEHVWLVDMKPVHKA